MEVIDARKWFWSGDTDCELDYLLCSRENLKVYRREWLENSLSD